jgi:hypothetical protein
MAGGRPVVAVDHPPPGRAGHDRGCGPGRPQSSGVHSQSCSKYVQDDHSILRAVSVIKSRASYHHPDIRPFQIGGDGIVLTGSLRPPDGR